MRQLERNATPGLADRLRTIRNWNPNKLVRRLDIRSKLAVAFLVLSGLPLAVVGWYAATQHFNALQRTATQEQWRSLVAVRERVGHFLQSVESDLDLISGSALVGDLVPSGDGARPSAPVGPTEEGQGARLMVVETAFRDFLRSKPHYFRIRLFNRRGVEIVDVVQGAGGPRALPSGTWRRTGFRYYRLLIDGLEGRETAFVPVELRRPATGNDEPSRSASRPSPKGRLVPADGVRVSEPREPGDLVAALSFVRPLRGSHDDLQGILVADVYARQLFDLLRRSDPRPGEDLLLVGPDGHYLYHSAKKTDWNTLLATRSDHRLDEDLSPRLVERILGDGSGVVSEETDAVVAHAPLFPVAGPNKGNYTVLSVIPKETVFESVYAVRRFVILTGFLTLVAAGVLALIAAHQFATPIRSLTRGAARIARGEFEHRLDIQTNDEIEDLAASFTSMGKALAAREEEIDRQREQLQRYAEHLEAMVAERTEELRASQSKLIQQEKMVAVGQLAAGVAHELGSPLATILCHAQMARETSKFAGDSAVVPGPDSELTESLAMIASEANRCREIVRDLLDFSRPSSEEWKPIAANDLVDRALNLMAHDLRRRGVELDVARSRDDPLLHGNRNRLQQVLVNLLLNAADAMPEGGRVTIRVSAEPGRDPGFGDDGPGPDPDGTVVLEVRDDGPGMDAETRARIFEPFFTTKDPGTGTGLGLWIVYNTVVDHGGAIAVDSAPNEGTRIRIRLPAMDTTGRGEVRRSGRSSAPARPGRS